MQRHILIVIILFYFSNLNAQKWALRLGFYNLKSYTQNTITSMNDKRGDLSINSDKFITYLHFNKRLYPAPQLSNFIDFSLSYAIDSTKSILAGFRYMDAWIYSSITNNFGTTVSGRTVYIPILRLNYSHTILRSKKDNPSVVNLLGGLAITFRGADGSSSSAGGWNSTTGALDSSGNFYFEYTSAKVVKTSRPKYPLPYLNVGVDGALRLSKRWKLGMELAFYAGTKTLYTQEIEGSTNDADFAYTLKLKPYFISGGIYFQYRIK